MARAETDLPAIKPESVDIEATLYSRSAHVRLPAGITPQDVHDWPQLWAEVQATNKALRRFDRVRLIAHDEAFLIPDAIVTGADTKGASLDFKRIVQLRKVS
jgi:hypothetical protein